MSIPKHITEHEILGVTSGGGGSSSTINGIEWYILGNDAAGTALMVEENVAYVYLNKGFTGSKVHVEAITVPTGGPITIDVNYHATDNANLVSIFTDQSKRPVLAAGEKAVDSVTPDIVNYAKGGIMSFSIDTIGLIIAGAKLIVSVEPAS